MRRLLRIRDARVFLFGWSVSVFGDWAIFIALGVWMKDLTDSNSAAGLVFFSGEARLVDLQEQQRDHDRDETKRVEDRDSAAADRRVDRGADEGRDQAQSFSDGLEQTVRLAEQITRQDHRHEGRPGRSGERAGGAVERSDRIDDPGIPAVVDEQKRENHDRLDRVGHDHHLPPRQTVDQQPRERRKQ